ncbi:MAG: hypothetical protein LBD77_01750 [Bifidobacteriaceae bacterium]|nr:hypothetical protein [Bifidobacteriaceae bacterium]
MSMIERIETKRLLGDSLLELARGTQFEKITAAQITRNCSLARRTLYYHFDGKLALGAWVHTEEMASHVNPGLFTKPIVHLWADCLEALRANDFLYRAIFRYPEVTRVAQRDTAQWVLSCIEHYDQALVVNEEIVFTAEFYARSVTGVITHWLHDPQGLSPSDVSRGLRAIMPPALEPFHIL